jgi:cyanoexosortase A
MPQVNSMPWIQRLHEPKFWLAGLATSIIAMHLTLVNRSGNNELFATSCLFWMVAGMLVWDRRQTLPLTSGLLSSLVGAILLLLVFLRSGGLPESPSVLRALPLMAVVGLGLLASGARQLRIYWKELLIFGLFAAYPLLELMLQLIDLSQITAKAATFMLWYSGFQVQRQGVFLTLPTGRVEVYGACSGLGSMLQMLSVSVLFLLMVQVRSRKSQLFCMGVALLLGFLVNAVRVALMAVLVSFSQKVSFEYWHTGDGSLIFSMIAVALFGGFCWVAFLRNPATTESEGK